MKAKPKAPIENQDPKDLPNGGKSPGAGTYHVTEIGDRPLALSQRISEAHAIAVMHCPDVSDK